MVSVENGQRANPYVTVMLITETVFCPVGNPVIRGQLITSYTSFICVIALCSVAVISLIVFVARRVLH